jgi:S1-C subfamily serine protease
MERGEMRPFNEPLPFVAQQARPAARAIACWAMVLALTACASTAKTADINSERHLGSVDDYSSNNPDLTDAFEIPQLSIVVRNGESKLQGSYQAEGVEVVGVPPGGPGAMAGLKGERRQVQTIMTLGLLAASMFFPPALMGLAALESSGVGESHEFIIAVDGIRTHDITDFEAALSRAEPGEIVYLTVVSNRQRKQLQVPLYQGHD